MSVKQSGVPTDSDHRTHIQDLWGHFQSFCHGNSGARYVVMLPSGQPFSDWSHHNRYSNRKNFHQHIVDAHRTAALQIGRIANQARLDGVA